MPQSDLSGPQADIKLTARQMLAAGRATEAAALLEEPAAAGRADAELHALLGIALCSGGRAGEAVQALETAVAIDPGHAAWFYNLGLAREQAGNARAALDAYHRAAAPHPSYERARAAITRLDGRAPLEATQLLDANEPTAPAAAPTIAFSPSTNASPAPARPFLTGETPAPGAAFAIPPPAPVYTPPAAVSKRPELTSDDICAMADPPEIVRLLQILYFIAAGGMAISGVLDILVALSALSSPNLRPLVAHRLTGALIGLGSGGFYFALARSFGHGRRLAYYTQVLLASLCIASGIGCFWVGSLLIVALVNAAILYFWLRPGPKAWFEIEGRPSLTASTTLN